MGRRTARLRSPGSELTRPSACACTPRQTERPRWLGAAPPGVDMSNFEIVAREDFSDVTYLLEVRHPLMAKAAKPGPVRHRHGARARRAHPADHRRLRPRQGHDHAGDPGGRQDHAGDAAGLPGRHSALRDGRPDGHPQPRSARPKKVVCVGGGLGVAPIFPQARAFKESGAYVIGVLGFRNKDLVFWEDKFRACCDELIVCTDDGSAGIKGLVTEGIKQAHRGACRHRRGGRHRPADHDEGLRRGDAARTASRPWSASTRSWSTAPACAAAAA